jgi:hypothetical protein
VKKNYYVYVARIFFKALASSCDELKNKKKSSAKKVYENLKKYCIKKIYLILLYKSKSEQIL